MEYLLNFRLVYDGFTLFNSSGINFINIGLLEFRGQSFHDAFDGLFMIIRVISWENQTCCSSHSSVLLIFSYWFFTLTHYTQKQHNKQYYRSILVHHKEERSVKYYKLIPELFHKSFRYITCPDFHNIQYN